MALHIQTTPPPRSTHEHYPSCRILPPRALALALHPDKAAAPLPAEAAASLFAAIKEAHGTLADPGARRRYDLQYAWLVDVLRASV